MTTSSEIGSDLEVITVKELAGILRIPKKTLYNCIKRGEIAGVQRYGHGIRINRAKALEQAKGGSATPRKG